MRLKSKNIFGIVVVGIFFFCSVSQAQINNGFIKHLSENKLYREHSAYLKELDSLKANPDSVVFLKTKYNLQYFNDSIFFLNYPKSKSLFIKDTCTNTLAGIKYLKRPSKEQTRFFYSFESEGNHFSNEIFQVWKASLNPREINPAVFPPKLQQDFMKYKKLYSRKPIVAAALSTAVPGLGKLYAGRKNSFYITLMTHIGLAVQSYEAVHKLGINNPFSIFSLSFSGLFYAANIYGSYNAVKEVKKETRNQFLYNASDYYTINCPCTLY